METPVALGPSEHVDSDSQPLLLVPEYTPQNAVSFTPVRTGRTLTGRRNEARARSETRDDQPARDQNEDQTLLYMTKMYPKGRRRHQQATH